MCPWRTSDIERYGAFAANAGYPQSISNPEPRTPNPPKASWRRLQIVHQTEVCPAARKGDRLLFLKQHCLKQAKLRDLETRIAPRKQPVPFSGTVKRRLKSGTNRRSRYTFALW